MFQEDYLFNNINKALIHSVALFIHYIIKSKNVEQLRDSILNMIFFIISFLFGQDLTDNYKKALRIF